MDSRGAAEWVHNKVWPLWWWRGLVGKNERSPFLSRIPLVAYHACRPLAFSIVLTDREPWTGYAKPATCTRQTFLPNTFARSTCRNSKKKMFGKRVIIALVVDKSTDHAKHISICSLPQYQRQRKSFFFRARGRARAENGITWHINVCSPVCTLIDNGKLANEIARFVAIAVKIFFDVYAVVKNKLNVVMRFLYYYRQWTIRVTAQWSKFVVDSLGCASWVHNILTTVMTRTRSVDRSTDNAKPHSIC